MNQLSFIRRLAAGAALTAMSAALPIALAQESGSQIMVQDTAVPTMTTTEGDIRLQVGEILEILPTSDIVNPSYSWILTQDRTFLQAGRTAVFRYRFIQPGTYSLIAQIEAGDQSTRITRTFSIDARARTPGIVSSASSSAMSVSGSGATPILVTLDPAGDNANRSVLQQDKDLLKLMPVNLDTKPLSLDIDITQDSDNDANPANDVDNKGTFFQLYAEPLYIWFASPLEDRKMSVITIVNGEAQVQPIEAASAAYAAQNGFLVSPADMNVQDMGEGNYAFSVAFVDGVTPTAPLLYQWTFGDGQESLLMNPTHTYTTNGTYTVTMQIKNLVNGSDVARAEQQITVTAATGAAASSAASSEAPVNNGTGNSFDMGTILLYGGLFLVFAILGLGGMFVISKLRKGKPLDERLADMEKSIVTKDAIAKTPHLVIPATATVSPVSAKPVAPAPTKEEFAKREENAASTSKPAETPRIDENAAPAWLKKGLETAPASAAPTPAPVPPKPVAPPAPVVPTPVAPPKPVTPPAPIVKPVVPAAPKPEPVTPPAPLPPKPAPAVIPTPSASVPTPKPVAPPAPAEPKPTPVVPPKSVTPPAPRVVVNPLIPSKPPVPVVPPVPKPAPAKPAELAAAAREEIPVPPVAKSPAPAAPKPESKPIEKQDEPIAFIRAESIEKPKDDQKKDQNA